MINIFQVQILRMGPWVERPQEYVPCIMRSIIHRKLLSKFCWSTLTKRNDTEVYMMNEQTTILKLIKGTKIIFVQNNVGNEHFPSILAVAKKSIPVDVDDEFLDVAINSVLCAIEDYP